MANKMKEKNVGSLLLAGLSDYNVALHEVSTLKVRKKEEVKKVNDNLDFLNDVLVNIVPTVEDKNERGDLKKATLDDIKKAEEELVAIEDGYKAAIKPHNKIMNNIKKTLPAGMFSAYTRVVAEGSEEAVELFDGECELWLTSMGCEGLSDTAIVKFGKVFVTLIGGTRRNSAENIVDGCSLRVAYTEATFRSLAIEAMIDYLVNVMKAFKINENNRLESIYNNNIVTTTDAA